MTVLISGCVKEEQKKELSEESKPEPQKTVIEEVTVPETVQEPEAEETNRQEILNEFPDSLNEAFTELDELN